MRALVAAVLLTIALVPGARAADDPVRATLRAGASQATLEMVVAPGWHVNSHAPRDEFLVPTSLALSPPAGVSVGEIAWPKPVEKALAFSAGKTMLLYEGTVRISAPLSGTAAAGAPPLKGMLRYQACNDSTCLPPRTLDLVAEPERRGAAGSAGGGAETDDVAAFVQRYGLGLTVLWVMALGLALNLTPCVYPMISVTVAFFGGRTGTDTGRAVRHALLYVLGICLSFAALGAAAALTGTLFGAAMQKPVVLGGIALLMVALACSNFGLYQLRMPQGVLQWAGRAGEGALGALFMGATMGVVGAPCIGPIVAALLLYVGAQQSVPLGLGLFFALGFGLGLPYVALALLAGRLRALPRGGAWLGWMEWLFGFVLLGLALHFATPLLPPIAVRTGWALLLASAGIALGFLDWGAGAGVRWARRLAGAAVVVVGISGLVVADAESQITWTPLSDAALAAAARAGRPVLIDFQAAWCLPCREMEQTTFRDPEVVRTLQSFATLKADVTAQDEATDELMASWRVPGVPTYVLLAPDGSERRRFIGFVPADRFASGLREVAGG